MKDKFTKFGKSPIGPEGVKTLDKYHTVEDGKTYFVTEVLLTETNEKIRIYYE